MRRAVGLLLLAVAGCSGTTGSGLVGFNAFAGGPEDATGGPLAFDTGWGFHITLDQARLHLGAVYLNQQVPSSGAGETSCVLPGIYVAEVFGPVDVDLLSPALVPFPQSGEGTATEARTAEVWLSGGDVDATSDPTVIFDVAGTATKGADVYPFRASVTIGPNRAIAVVNPAFPSANPICKQRIVTRIAVDLLPTDGGTLTVHVDPRHVFDAVDFSSLPPDPTNPGAFVISDSNAGAGAALFKGLRANAGVYRFTWSN